MIDEANLRERLRRFLSVPEGASRRQMRRARDRVMQGCRDDMLSDDEERKLTARRRLEEVDRAFEYLTEPKKFRDFLELINDKFLAGTAEPGTFVHSVLLAVASEDNGSDTSAREAASHEPGFDRAAGGSGSDFQVLSEHETGSLQSRSSSQSQKIAREREALKQLRKNRLAKAPKIGKQQRIELEKERKEALNTIAEAARSGAKKRAEELSSKGVTDSEQFYERVYTSALQSASSARSDALKRMTNRRLPVDETILDELELAVSDGAEQATEREYNYLEGILAAARPKTNRRSPLMVAIILMTIAGTLIIFCNIGEFIATNRKDSIGRQIDAANTGTTGSAAKNIPPVVSPDKLIATAAPLIPAAGSAGPAGSSTTLDLLGAADYNAGCKAFTSGDKQKAIAHFTTAIAKNTNVHQFFYNRGCAFLSSGMYDSALADFSAALAVRSDLMQAKYNMGLVYLTSAADEINQPVAVASVRSSSFRQPAVLLRLAINEFNAVIDKMPDLAQPYYNRALARFRLGDLQGAASDFLSASKRDPAMRAADENRAVVKILIEKPGSSPAPAGNKADAPIGPVGPPGPGYY